MSDTKGYTLVEILVAMAISMVLFVAIYAVVNSVQKSSAGIERKVTAQQDVRPALELMAMEIRMASYHGFNDVIWPDPGTCVAAASQSYRGIQEATASSLTVEMDINGNDTVGDENEIIRYAYDAANQYITRKTIRSPGCTTGGDQAFLGGTVASQKTVRVINDATRPVFRYNDGSGNAIAALPAGIPNIRTIEITLMVETEDIDPSTGLRKTMIYSTAIIPRNHAPDQ